MLFISMGLLIYQLSTSKETVYPLRVCLSMENFCFFVGNVKKKLALQCGMNKLSLYNREPHLSGSFKNYSKKFVKVQLMVR
jgi:hypothetical protein